MHFLNHQLQKDLLIPEKKDPEATGGPRAEVKLEFEIDIYDLSTVEGIAQRKRDCSDVDSRIDKLKIKPHIHGDGEEKHTLYYIDQPNNPNRYIGCFACEKKFTQDDKGEWKKDQGEKYDVSKNRLYHYYGRKFLKFFRLNILLKSAETLIRRIDLWIAVAFFTLFGKAGEKIDFNSPITGVFWQQLGLIPYVLLFLFVAFVAVHLLNIIYEVIVVKVWSERQRHKRKRFTDLSNKAHETYNLAPDYSYEYWSDEEDNCAAADPDVEYLNRDRLKKLKKKKNGGNLNSRVSAEESFNGKRTSGGFNGKGPWQRRKYVGLNSY